MANSIKRICASGWFVRWKVTTARPIPAIMLLNLKNILRTSEDKPSAQKLDVLIRKSVILKPEKSYQKGERPVMPRFVFDKVFTVWVQTFVASKLLGVAVQNQCVPAAKVCELRIEWGPHLTFHFFTFVVVLIFEIVKLQY